MAFAYAVFAQFLSLEVAALLEGKKKGRFTFRGWVESP